MTAPALTEVLTEIAALLRSAESQITWIPDEHVDAEVREEYNDRRTTLSRLLLAQAARLDGIVIGIRLPH